MEEEKEDPPKKRKFISVKRKVELAEEGIRVLQDADEHLKKFARENNVQPSQIRRYIKELPQLRVALERRRTAPLTMHTGPGSSILHLEDQLYSWFVQKRDAGMTISVNLLVLKASNLDRDFRNKSASAKYSCIRRFMKKKNLAIRSVTHESQEVPEEKKAEAIGFIEK